MAISPAAFESLSEKAILEPLAYLVIYESWQIISDRALRSFLILIFKTLVVR